MERLIPDLPDDVTGIGIKLSGGADSAIVLYALCEYVKTRPGVKIYPMTVDHAGKAYQIKFAKKVIDFCKEEFGEEIFGKHYTDVCNDEKSYTRVQDALNESMYKEKVITCHFAGITANPPDEVSKSFGHIPPIDRDPKIERPIKRNYAYRPFVNLDKKHVKKWYDKYNVLETLFPLTRSCEAFTDNFEAHCEECWFCKERKWGFGRFE